MGYVESFVLLTKYLDGQKFSAVIVVILAELSFELCLRRGFPEHICLPLHLAAYLPTYLPARVYVSAYLFTSRSLKSSSYSRNPEDHSALDTFFPFLLPEATLTSLDAKYFVESKEGREMTNQERT